jgi:histidine triad (HIT) family protein
MDCIFCKIANKEMNSKIIRDDEEVIAFHDIHPQAPVHALVVPKKHISRITEMNESDQRLIGKMIYVGKEVAQELGVSDSGFRLVLNNGPDANQTVHHIHLHVIGGRRMGWPPG